MTSGAELLRCCYLHLYYNRNIPDNLCVLASYKTSAFHRTPLDL